MKKISMLFVIPLLLLALQVRAVEYELPDLDGKIQSLAQYRGKWVVVNYWATWCSTCMKELPELIELYEHNKDKGVMVIGINFEDIDLPQLRQAVAERGIPFPVWRSMPVPMTPLGRVPALPTTYIIDPGGKRVAGEVGMVSRKNLEDYIAEKMQGGEYDKNAVTK